MSVISAMTLEELAAIIIDIGEFETIEAAAAAGFFTGEAGAVAQLVTTSGGAASVVSSSTATALELAQEGASLAASQVSKKTATAGLLKTATGYKPAALLSMDLGVVAAAAAPLIGVSLGANLYQQNPKLWTDLSTKLLPFCYPGTTQIPTWVDIVEDVQTGSIAYHVLTSLGVINSTKEVLQTYDIQKQTTYTNPVGGSVVSGSPVIGMTVLDGQVNEIVGSPEVFATHDPDGRTDLVIRNGTFHTQDQQGWSGRWWSGNPSYMGDCPFPNNYPRSAQSAENFANQPDVTSESSFPTPGISPWAGEPAPAIEPWPNLPVIVPFPGPGVDPETEPSAPVTPGEPEPEVIPFPTPDAPPDGWPEEEPWPTVIPFPWENPDPEGDPWPEVIPFPLPEEPPEDWPNKPETWPEPYPDTEPWPQEPEQWPETVPWPENPPDDWPDEPWPETPEEWPEEVPWPENPPDDWPEEVPWPETPEEWPEEIPWPETKPEDWPEEWPKKPWPESPEQWPEDVPWPTPWPENWPEDQPWPVPWPEEIPYPIPMPQPYPSPDPDDEPDPGEIAEPDTVIDPWIQPNPDPKVNPDPMDEPMPGPEQDPSQPGEPISPFEPTPDPNPDSPIQPEPEPDPDPDPDTPPVNPIPPPIGISPIPAMPDTPSAFDSTHGLISVYNPTPAELYAFADWLWVTYADATIDKIWNNPFDGVITLFELYCDPTIDGRKNIRSGFLDSGIAADTVSRYTEINCGTLGIPEYYGNYFDYSPYSKAHIYLPFIGIQELNVDDIVGHFVNVTYRIDEYNGSCIAMITCAKVTEVNGEDVEYSNTMYQFSGNCAVELPLTGGSQANIKAGMMTADAYQQAANISAMGQLVGGIASTVGGLLSLNAGSVGSGIGSMIGAAGTAAYGQANALSNMLSGKSTVQKSGSFGASHGALGIKTPFITVTRPKQIDVANYNKLYGFPAHKMVTVGTCEGYLRCREVHVKSATATDAEKSLIEQMLKTGVYVN